MEGVTDREIRIGACHDEYLLIRVGSGPESDGSFSAAIEVRVGAFGGKTGTEFDSGELGGFADELQVLYDSLHGKAVFVAAGPELELTFSGDGKGHIRADGTLWEDDKWGASLRFCIALDQTELPAIIASLRRCDP